MVHSVSMRINADVDFCRSGASRTPSSDTYCGPFALSEPEISSTINYIRGRGNVKGYWNMHSYGMEIIFPYAWTTAVTPDRAAHLAAAQRMWDAIRAATGAEYDRPRRPNQIYSGFLMDALYILGVKYPGLIELRDRGQFGFLLPESQICTQSLEIWQGVLAHAEYVLAN